MVILPKAPARVSRRFLIVVEEPEGDDDAMFDISPPKSKQSENYRSKGIGKLAARRPFAVMELGHACHRYKDN